MSEMSSISTLEVALENGRVIRFGRVVAELVENDQDTSVLHSSCSNE